jgi:hypothetical protein
MAASNLACLPSILASIFSELACAQDIALDADGVGLGLDGRDLSDSLLVRMVKAGATDARRADSDQADVLVRNADRSTTS